MKIKQIEKNRLLELAEEIEEALRHCRCADELLDEFFYLARATRPKLTNGQINRLAKVVRQLKSARKPSHALSDSVRLFRKKVLRSTVRSLKHGQRLSQAPWLPGLPPGQRRVIEIGPPGIRLRSYRSARVILFHRGFHRCWYCGRLFTGAHDPVVSAEHLKPLREGGENTLGWPSLEQPGTQSRLERGNIVLACVRCNHAVNHYEQTRRPALVKQA